MQGNWTVTVKSKNASFPQHFIVNGATFGNGVHSGTVGTSVNVYGSQWTIAIQNNPGNGWQLSETKLKFPHKTGGNYEFEILSNDAGNDSDFDDFTLKCTTPANINDFIIYGNVTLYSGRCVFNPCRRLPFVIETYPGLVKALKNPLLRDWIEKYYPDRIPPIHIVNPNPPDPPYFNPIVFDLSGEAIQPKTTLQYSRKAVEDKKSISKAEKENRPEEFAISNFELIKPSQISSSERKFAISSDTISLTKAIEGLFHPCFTNVGSNLSLTFEEYDRTAAELLGGSYTGTGNRRLLGDCITDMNGNYIFRFRFDMTIPGLEDASDIATGEDVNTILFPDVIVKIVEYSPLQVRYESAPFYNISNLKRIDLCLPESKVRVTSSCFNGNLIGGIGNVFIGGNQNTTGSTTATATQRYEYGNYLQSNGKISVNSPLALFNVECAGWAGTIDIKGCMYDKSKSPANNKISWYTIRIRRSGTPDWIKVSENYKHVIFGSHPPGYIGDDVGPFYPNVGGILDGHMPVYKNIQREVEVDGIPWLNVNLDRFIQLNTTLYDGILGITTPGTFYVRVDGYDSAGVHVADQTDLIALFIHNKGLNFGMTNPVIDDPSVVKSDCQLYRLTDGQMHTPIKFSFRANDPEGFVNQYQLNISRCPQTSIDLNPSIPADVSLSGTYTFPQSPAGSNPANLHNACPGYTGSLHDYSTVDLVNVVIQPPAADDGWIKAGEYFTIYSFGLTAGQRITNGYNTGVDDHYVAYGQIMMERLNP